MLCFDVPGDCLSVSFHWWRSQLCGVAAFVCLVAAFVVQRMILRAINQKRGKDRAISGRFYYFCGISGILRTESLYRDCYPSGKLVRLCWAFRVFFFLFVIAAA
jgi:hypothetical protein